MQVHLTSSDASRVHILDLKSQLSIPGILEEDNVVQLLLEIASISLTVVSLALLKVATWKDECVVQRLYKKE